jgi:hypothetical protein
MCTKNDACTASPQADGTLTQNHFAELFSFWDAALIRLR